MDATISSLLEDKRNLEEKLCITNEIVKKLEADVKAKGNNSNLSFESNASSTSPSARKSQDRELPQPRVIYKTNSILPQKLYRNFVIFRNLLMLSLRYDAIGGLAHTTSGDVSRIGTIHDMCPA